jgi:hypothetical protein
MDEVSSVASLITTLVNIGQFLEVKESGSDLALVKSQLESIKISFEIFQDSTQETTQNKRKAQMEATIANCNSKIERVGDFWDK